MASLLSLISAGILSDSLFGFLDSKDIARLIACSRTLVQYVKHFRHFEYHFHLVDVGSWPEPVLVSQLVLASRFKANKTTRLHAIIYFIKFSPTIEKNQHKK